MKIATMKLEKFIFLMTNFNEEDYDDKLCLEPRPKKKKKNRKGSNVENMIDLLSAMDKKREEER